AALGGVVGTNMAYDTSKQLTQYFNKKKYGFSNPSRFAVKAGGHFFYDYKKSQNTPRILSALRQQKTKVRALKLEKEHPGLLKACNEVIVKAKNSDSEST